jgi:hypothetical protein
MVETQKARRVAKAKLVWDTNRSKVAKVAVKPQAAKARETQEPQEPAGQDRAKEGAAAAADTTAGPEAEE